MFVKKFFNYFTGYVNIRVEGFYVERFINLCISKRILLTNIQRKKSTIIYANVSATDYKKLKAIARKTKSKMRIQTEKGLPFIMHKYRRRKIFGVLFLLVLVGIIVSSNYIWNIDINGNVNISKEELLRSLEENGLKVGLSKNDMDTNEVIRKIRLNRDDIAWIGITVKGTNAIVKIKEVDKAPDIIDKDDYCDIVSDKNAIITKISVQNGTAAVDVGDIVEPGTILVNGYLEGKYTGIRYVHSSAEIDAKVWYTKKKRASFIQQIPVQTGNEEKKYSIKFKKNQINLYKRFSKFEKYDTICEDKKIMLFSNFYLPLEIVKKTNKEYTLQEKIYTEDELETILVEQLKDELLQEIKNENSIINSNINKKIDGGEMEVELTYETLENIGIEQKMDI